MTREREDFFEHLRKPVKPKAGFVNQRSTIKALKESVNSVNSKTGLPPKLLELFQARPSLQPGAEIKKKKPKLPYTGIADLVQYFAAPGDAEYEPEPPSNRPPSPRSCRNPELPYQARLDTETKAEKKTRITQWKKEEAQSQVEAAVRQWDPSKNPEIEGDPFKTLFVSRLSYEVNDKKLRKEFEEYGPIKSIKVIQDQAGKSRGYAFIEFEHKKDMKEAYKLGDGRKVEGRRVVVDVERGRTVENWRPRKFGGGLGGQGREARPPKKKGAAAGPGGPIDDRRGPPLDSRPRDEFRPPPRDERPRSPPRGGPDRKREREPSPRRRREDEGKRLREDDRRDSGRRRERDML